MLHRFSRCFNLLIAVALLIVALPSVDQTTAHAAADDSCNLPSVVFLGEGPGTYDLPDGYDTLIVKRWSPFRFGPIEGDSVTLTTADNGREAGWIARVWAMTGRDIPPAHFGEKVSLGDIAANTLVRTNVIDDDDDGRLTRVVNESENVYTVLNPAMVQPVEFTTNHRGEYFIDSPDSIAFWPVCVTPWDKSSVTVDGVCANGMITMTVTNTGENMDGTTPYRIYRNGQLLESGNVRLDAGQRRFWTFFDGQRYRLEVDQRPGHPGNSEPNATVDSCQAPTATPTNTVTLTPSATPTQPTATPTNTPTATPTNTVTLTPSATPTQPSMTATPTAPPTDLEPGDEPQSRVYLPLIANSDEIVVGDVPAVPPTE